MRFEDHLRPWFECPVAVIDCETTGPDAATCAPVEVAVVRFERGEIVGRWSSRFFPDGPIPPSATAVHGITNQDVQSAPSARTLLHGFLVTAASDLLCDAVPCGYNGNAFDRVLLHRYCRDADVFRPALNPQWPWLDPLVIARRIDKYVSGKGRHQLTATCERHGVQMTGSAHTALADAEACGKLLFSPAFRAALGDCTISEVLRRQAGHAEQQKRDFETWLAGQPPKPTP